MKNKRGLSAIVITLITIVLGLVGIGAVWVVVSNVLKSQSQTASTSFGSMMISLEMQKVGLNSNGDVSITLKRNQGEGDLKAINFVISDGTNSKVIRKETAIAELGEQTFTLTYAELGAMAVRTISVAPIINSNGQEGVGNIIGSYSFETEALNSQSSPGTSCKSLLSTSRGDGIYWIDTDGIGTGNPEFQVYCDMTTDGGGWTLGAICHPENNPNYPNYLASVPASKCWDVNAVGSVLSPFSATTAKLSDAVIRAILTSGDKTTRANWIQQYRYDALSPTNHFVYNLFDGPNLWRWSSYGCGESGNTARNFYYKANYGDGWGTAITPMNTGCSCAVNGWSNTLQVSCGALGTWIAGCENAPSSGHCCACVKYDERANIILYLR